MNPNIYGVIFKLGLEIFGLTAMFGILFVALISTLRNNTAEANYKFHSKMDALHNPNLQAWAESLNQINDIGDMNK